MKKKINKKLPKLTKKQEIFAKEYLDTGNGVRAALKAYDTTDYFTAGNIASDNLRKPMVIAFLESVAEQVASNMHRLAISAESEQVQVAAGKDILDRAGFKPVEKRELTGKDGKDLIPLTGDKEVINNALDNI